MNQYVFCVLLLSLILIIAIMAIKIFFTPNGRNMEMSHLQKRLNHNVGCEYCDGIRVVRDSVSGSQIHIYKNDKRPVMENNDLSINIKFCPMCGKKLI